MTALKVIWGIVRIALTLGITVLVLSVPESKFESIMVSIVLMTYAMVRVAGIAQLHLVTVQSAAQTRHFSELAAHLNYPRMGEYHAAIQNDNTTVATSERNAAIEQFAMGLIWFAAVIYLIAAVL
jgi:hypothetical protein